MKINRRIYVSMPADRWLSENQNELKWAIVAEIEKIGYIPEIFTSPRVMPGLASSMAWSAKGAYDVARRCVGAAIIGVPRWKFETPGRTYNMTTDFCAYEGALVHSLDLPIFIVAQNDIERRTVFDNSYGHYIGEFDANDNKEWLKTGNFLTPFSYWKNKLADRRDIFLGYCSNSQKTAKKIKQFITKELGGSVLDWHTDFAFASSIMEQIKKASERCCAGIFLFTKDDQLSDKAKAEKAVPRDNVIFETGYFIHSKGKDHVLIIRQDGVKMPADLGGDIYATLEDKSDIEPIKNSIERFIGNF